MNSSAVIRVCGELQMRDCALVRPLEDWGKSWNSCPWFCLAEVFFSGWIELGPTVSPISWKDGSITSVCPQSFAWSSVIVSAIGTCVSNSSWAGSDWPNHPITPTQIGQLYQPYIICDHRERTFREGQEPDGVRHFTRAYPHLVSLVNDLLLLRIPTNSMQDYCAQPHPPLRVANRFPKPLKRVVMVSWPTLKRNRTAVTGETSHSGREFADVNPGDGNPCGFTTLLSEVTMCAHGGSSGAPLLNGLAEFAGVLHSGNHTTCYFVSIGNIRQTLTAWGIII